jgi:hypothetical protein
MDLWTCCASGLAKPLHFEDNNRIMGGKYLNKEMNILSVSTCKHYSALKNEMVKFLI